MIVCEHSDDKEEVLLGRVKCDSSETRDAVMEEALRKIRILRELICSSRD